jgi:hypothetical protein
VSVFKGRRTYEDRKISTRPGVKCQANIDLLGLVDNSVSVQY